MILIPEIDAPPEPRPSGRSRIIRMPICQPGIGFPHDFLQFPEFLKEARTTIIDRLGFRIAFEERMGVRFDEPERVGTRRLLVACHFLLPETPFGKGDLVAEEVAACERVPEAENSSERLDAFIRVFAECLLICNLDDEVIICVTCETRETIPSHFVLEIRLGDRRAIAIV